MPNWKQILDETNVTGSQHDTVRRKYMAELHALTKRNVVTYYSGWLQKAHIMGQFPDAFSLHDQDKNGFMAVFHQLDKSKGLDLILHTPGGGIAATESLVEYLRAIFNGDVRAIVPQLAMSAGTMLALSCKSIVMGKHSSLGPIDPQLGNVAAHLAIEELAKAKAEIKQDPSTIPVWQALLAKYPPAFFERCNKAISWSEALVEQWLTTGMFKAKTKAGKAKAAQKAKKIVAELGTPQVQKSHDRHISAAKLKGLGVVIEELEANQALQDAVLTVHHACIQTLTATQACKIIENHKGVSFIASVNVRQQ